MKRIKGGSKKRDFLNFLKWVEKSLDPHIVRFLNARKAEWEYWQSRDRKSLGRYPGLTEGLTDAYSADAYALRRAFYYVKRLRYIEIRKKGDRLMLALTDRGKIKLLGDRISAAKELPGKKVLLVIFDVPVRANRERKALWQFLRANGFQMLQHSVWYTRQDARIPLTELVESLGIEDWIQIAIADFHFE